MSEAQEQEAVIEYCAWRKLPIFHIPNGGSRNKAEAAHLKRQGVKPGVPDLFLPVAAGGRHGLFIEMKAKGGRLRDAQREWLALLAANGYEAVCCFGAESAIQTIEEYLHRAS